MNERTLELYEAAHVTHTAIDPFNNMPYETIVFSAEKFAELIVRECARQVRNTDLEDVEDGDSAVLRAASEQVKEHFGVE